MRLTDAQTLLLIGAITLGTTITRFLPFLLFPDHKKAPAYILSLGRTLPSAMMGLLVIYCLKNLSFLAFPFGIPELIGVTAVVLVHVWKRNTLLSIGGGTALYMLLLYLVF